MLGGLGDTDIPHRLHAFFSDLAEYFSVGNHAKIAEAYIWPVVVYLDGKILIEIDRDESMRSIALIRDLALAKGAERISAEIMGYSGRLDQRFSVDVRWSFLDGRGQTVATGHVRYFCRIDPEDNVGIEMVEYLQLPFPELSRDIPGPRYHH